MRTLTESFTRAAGFCIVVIAILMSIPLIQLIVEAHEKGFTNDISLGITVLIQLTPLLIWIFVPILSLFNLALHFSRIAPFIYMSKWMLLIEIGLYIAGYPALNALSLIDKHILNNIHNNFLLLVTTPFVFVLVIFIPARILLPQKIKRKISILWRMQQRYYRLNPQYLSQTADVTLCIIIPLIILFIPVMTIISLM